MFWVAGRIAADVRFHFFLCLSPAATLRLDPHEIEPCPAQPPRNRCAWYNRQLGQCSCVSTTPHRQFPPTPGGFGCTHRGARTLVKLHTELKFYEVYDTRNKIRAVAAAASAAHLQLVTTS